MLIENGYDMPRWGQKLIERYQRRDRMRAEKAQAAASPKYAIKEPDPDAFDPEVAARGAAFFTKIQVKIRAWIIARRPRPPLALCLAETAPLCPVPEIRPAAGLDRAGPPPQTPF